MSTNILSRKNKYTGFAQEVRHSENALQQKELSCSRWQAFLWSNLREERESE